MKLIDNTPTGTVKGIAHVNRGDLPHEWREMEFPVYSPEDQARSHRLRDARVKAGLSLRDACELIGVTVVELSALERCRVRFETPQDEARALELYRENGPSLDATRSHLAEVTRKIESYSGGDRPPSPPVSLLKEELRLRRLVDELEREEH